ncbi:MAG: tetratricopeptide repeat protein, partial [Candidatus Eremiobacteraeota bacterium]|nr:tetratricopeptide repeat protein [Candidatus Eremiobacteraeota bacterium]
WINTGDVLDASGEPQRALDCYQKAQTLRPGQDARLLNLMGMAAARVGDASAEGILRQALEADPGYLLAWQNLCLLLAGQGRLEEALEVSNRAAELGPRDARVFLSRGMLLYQAQRFREAAAALENCVALDPTAGAGWNYLGESYLALNDQSKAANCFERAMQAEPTMALAWRNAARVRILEKDYEKALQLLDRALELSPQEGLAHYLRGSALVCLERLDEAMASFTRAAELGEPHAAAALKKLQPSESIFKKAARSLGLAKKRP